MYAFFRPEVNITYISSRRAHEFTCAAKRCLSKGKTGRVVRRYLDTGDKTSTSGLRGHAEVCWGVETVTNAKGKEIDDVRQVLKGAKMHNGSITALFERVGKGQVLYSHRPHTKVETRYVSIVESFTKTHQRSQG